MNLKTIVVSFLIATSVAIAAIGCAGQPANQPEKKPEAKQQTEQKSDGFVSKQADLAAGSAVNVSGPAAQPKGIPHDLKDRQNCQKCHEKLKDGHPAVTQCIQCHIPLNPN